MERQESDGTVSAKPQILTNNTLDVHLNFRLSPKPLSRMVASTGFCKVAGRLPTGALKGLFLSESVG